MGFSAGQQPILDSPTRSPVLVPVSYCKAPAELIQDRQSDYRSGSKKVVAHLCGVREYRYGTWVGQFVLSSSSTCSTSNITERPKRRYEVW